MAIGELLFLAREVERLELELRKEKKRSELRLKQRNDLIPQIDHGVIHGTEKWNNRCEETEILLDKEIEAEVDKVK